MQVYEQEVIAVAEAVAKAERTNDAAALGKLLHEQFVGIGPVGFILTKEQWLQRLESGDLSYVSLELHETSARVFDACAIVVTHQSQVADYKDQEVRAELRISLTMVRGGGMWQIVGMQMSPIGQPPQFAPKVAT